MLRLLFNPEKLSGSGVSPATISIVRVSNAVASLQTRGMSLVGLHGGLKLLTWMTTRSKVTSSKSVASAEALGFCCGRKTVSLDSPLVALARSVLSADSRELPPHFVTSAEKRLGREKLLTFIETLNLDYLENKGVVSSE